MDILRFDGPDATTPPRGHNAIADASVAQECARASFTDSSPHLGQPRAEAIRPSRRRHSYRRARGQPRGPPAPPGRPPLSPWPPRPPARPTSRRKAPGRICGCWCLAANRIDLKRLNRSAETVAPASRGKNLQRRSDAPAACFRGDEHVATSPRQPSSRSSAVKGVAEGLLERGPASSSASRIVGPGRCGKCRPGRRARGSRDFPAKRAKLACDSVVLVAHTARF
jgi:hypothetical protein